MKYFYFLSSLDFEGVANKRIEEITSDAIILVWKMNFGIFQFDDANALFLNSMMLMLFNFTIRWNSMIILVAFRFSTEKLASYLSIKHIFPFNMKLKLFYLFCAFTFAFIQPAKSAISYLNLIKFYEKSVNDFISNRLSGKHIKTILNDFTINFSFYF